MIGSDGAVKVRYLEKGCSNTSVIHNIGPRIVKILSTYCVSGVCGSSFCFISILEGSENSGTARLYLAR